MSNVNKLKFKTIFSLRTKVELDKLGFKPVMETDNRDKEGYKCWVYELTPELSAVLDKLWGGQKNG